MEHLLLHILTLSLCKQSFSFHSSDAFLVCAEHLSAMCGKSVFKVRKLRNKCFFFIYYLECKSIWTLGSLHMWLTIYSFHNCISHIFMLVKNLNLHFLLF